MTKLDNLWLVLALMGQSSAALAIQPTLVAIDRDKDGNYTYRYKIKIDAMVELSCGSKEPDPDFFTVFNFDGFIRGSEQQPPGWTFKTSTNGVTPLRGGRAVLAPIDTPGIPNLTWSCAGATIKGPAEITGFAVRTKVKDTMLGEYGTQETRLEPIGVGADASAKSKEARIGTITVPSLKVHQ